MEEERADELENKQLNLLGHNSWFLTRDAKNAAKNSSPHRNDGGRKKQKIKMWRMAEKHSSVGPHSQGCL